MPSAKVLSYLTISRKLMWTIIRRGGSCNGRRVLRQTLKRLLLLRHSIMQILANDLCPDMVPAFALGVEPPEYGLVDRRFRNPSQHLITPSTQARSYLRLAILESMAAMSAFHFIWWTGIGAVDRFTKQLSPLSSQRSNDFRCSGRYKNW